MTEEYENNYEDDYLGTIISHSYFLYYLSVPDMSTNIQGETLIEDLEYMPSCSHNHENQDGQSKFPQYQSIHKFSNPNLERIPRNLLCTTIATQYVVEEFLHHNAHQSRTSNLYGNF